MLGSDAATKDVKTLLKLTLELFPNAVLVIRDPGPALDAMTPEFLVKADLTADYTAERMDFLRFFDHQSDHDPAVTRAQKVRFQDSMATFLQGGALVPSPDL